jgi:hypothetical protein
MAPAQQWSSRPRRFRLARGKSCPLALATAYASSALPQIFRLVVRRDHQFLSLAAARDGFEWSAKTHAILYLNQPAAQASNRIESI